MSMSSQRVREGMLQTPVCEFTHPDTNSRVGYVAMIHAADPAYYEAANARIARYESAGAVVQYEGARRLTESEEMQFPEEAKQVEALFTSMNGMLVWLAKMKGLTFQHDIIRPSSEWRNSDISGLELIRLLGPESVERMTGALPALQKAEDTISPDILQSVFNIGLRFKPMVLGMRLARHPLRQSRENSITVGHRNKSALRAVDEVIATEPGRDIVMLWGGAHLRGIGRGLKQRGYKLTNQEWQSAFSLSNTRNRSDS